MAARRKTARYRAKREKEQADAPASRREASSRGARQEREPAGRGRAGGRRRSSAARRGRGETDDGGGGRGTGLKADRSGKVQIQCPACTAQYKIPIAKAEAQVTCARCQRVWIPSAQGSRGKAKQADHSKAIFAFVGGIIVVVIIALIINASMADEEVAKPRNEVQEAPNLGSKTEQVQAVMAWAKAVSNGERFLIESQSHMDGIQKQLGIDPKNVYSRSRDEPRVALKDKILDAILESDDAMCFRNINSTTGKITDAAMLDQIDGKVRLEIYQKNSLQASVALVSYVKDEDNRYRVSGWKVENLAARTLSAAEKKRRAKRTKKHELIEKPQEREVMLGGEKVSVRESKLVPLGHMKDTPKELQTKIDKLINELIDFKSDPRIRNRAHEDLRDIGKPAIPRLLNKMYELKLTTKDDVLRINLVVRCLRSLTSQSFAFNPMEGQGKGMGATEKERLSALKQWYAWWYDYAYSERWNEDVDTEEELFMTREEKDALRKKEQDAARAKRKAEREARRKR